MNTVRCGIHGLYCINSKSRSRGHGCPICKDIKGEALIDAYLYTKGIEFKLRVKFPDLVYLDYLKYDIYLPEVNVAIEYDDQKHFEPIPGEEAAFARRQLKDLMKTSYAKERGIELIRIRYDENAAEVLDQWVLRHFTKI